jgi:hypothetical protein
MKHIIASSLLLIAFAAPALSQTQTVPPEKDDVSSGDVLMRADLLNLFLWRNDTDFDDSKPLWDEDGQSAGAFATVLTPTFAWYPSRSLRITYQTELGLNYWSKHDPDIEGGFSPSMLVMKHRELHGSGEIDDNFGFKLGYGRFEDPTGLFLNHWIGAAQMWVGEDQDRLGVFVGQVPDSSYEGLDVTENNFSRDIFVYGLRFDYEIDHGWFMATAVHALTDTHLPGQERWLVCPMLHIEAGDDDLKLIMDAILQVGQAEGQTLDGHIQQLIAWAAQLHFLWGITDRFKLWPSVLELNALVTSPDDAQPDNDMQHAFWSSGKNRSATLMLTEDEIRDWYDNYDERFGTRQGGFYNNRAGLLLAELVGTWYVERAWSVKLVVAGASVLKPANALGHSFVGVELDLISEFWFKDYAGMQVAAGVLLPGKAAGALVNFIDRAATDPVGMVEISVLLRY